MLGGAFVFALAGLSVAVAATCSTWLLHPRSRIDTVVTFGVIAPSNVAASMLAAGIPGVLRPVTLLLLTGTWALGSLVAVRRREAPSNTRWSAGLDNWRRHPWTAALVLLAAVALAWQMIVALVLPPYAYDALTYHLTTVAFWVQSGTVAPSPLSRCCAYYPFTSDLLAGFPAVLLHDDSLVGLTQIPFVLLGSAATAGLARVAGLRRSAAAAAGAIFAVTPAVLAQAPTNYVDVILAALVLSALYSACRYAQTGAGQHLLIAGLAAGLVLGTKGIGPLWAIVLFLLAGVAAIIAVSGGLTTKASSLKTLAVSVGIGVPLGGWWYLRNFIATGNPLYPFTINVMGTTIFRGPLDVGQTLTVPPIGPDAPWPVTVALNWAADLKFWTQGSYDYQQRLGGLGPAWVWLGLPLLIVMVFVQLRRRNMALLAVAGVLLVFLVQPYRWWARFTLPLSALGAIAVAWAASEAPWRWFRLVLNTVTVMLAVAGVFLSSYAIDPQARAAEISAARVMTLIGTPRSDRSLGRLFHSEYAFLDHVPDNATMAVDVDADRIRFLSPFFGPRFTRRVIPDTTGMAPSDAWIISSPGRPLDRAATASHLLVSDVRGVRAWAPRQQSPTSQRR